MDSQRKNKTGTSSAKKSFLKSSFYDFSDISAQSENGFKKDMDETEFRKKQHKDWLALIIGIPAFIAALYLIVLIAKQ